MITPARASVVVPIGFVLLTAWAISLMAQSQGKLIGSLEVMVDGKYQPATLPLKELAEGQTLEVFVTGAVQSGIMTPVGETTGTVIHFQNKTWELDLSSDPKMIAEVAANEGSEFIVIGSVCEKAGVKVKNRTILSVESHTISPVGG
jgi:hypothetical protein